MALYICVSYIFLVLFIEILGKVEFQKYIRVKGVFFYSKVSLIMFIWYIKWKLWGTN